MIGVLASRHLLATASLAARVAEQQGQARQAREAQEAARQTEEKRLASAREAAILMHPLPRKHEMGTEADHAVLDNDPRSVYFHQMQNGMYMRMAPLAGVLGAHDD